MTTTAAATFPSNITPNALDSVQAQALNTWLTANKDALPEATHQQAAHCAVLVLEASAVPSDLLQRLEELEANQALIALYVVRILLDAQQKVPPALMTLAMRAPDVRLLQES